MKHSKDILNYTALPGTPFCYLYACAQNGHDIKSKTVWYATYLFFILQLWKKISVGRLYAELF